MELVAHHQPALGEVPDGVVIGPGVRLAQVVREDKAQGNSHQEAQDNRSPVEPIPVNIQLSFHLSRTKDLIYLKTQKLT